MVSNRSLIANTYTQTGKRKLSWINLITFIQLPINFHTGLIFAFVSAETSTNKFQWFNIFLWLNQPEFFSTALHWGEGFGRTLYLTVFHNHDLRGNSGLIHSFPSDNFYTQFFSNREDMRIVTCWIHMQLPPVNMTFQYIRFSSLDYKIHIACQSTLCMSWTLINKKLWLFGHVSGDDQNVNVLHGLVNVARLTQVLNGTNTTSKQALVF